MTICDDIDASIEAQRDARHGRSGNPALLGWTALLTAVGACWLTIALPLALLLTVLALRRQRGWQAWAACACLAAWVLRVMFFPPGLYVS